MLFNSIEFLSIFLPLVFLGFHILYDSNNNNVIYLLIIASFVFYSMSGLGNLTLLIFSLTINYFFARYLSKNKKIGVLFLGVITNLAILAYFKYKYFIIDLFNVDFQTLQNYTIPVAISFFTFQLIAYLVDLYKGNKNELTLSSYLLFIVFFPQLIAGPIVHHKYIRKEFDYSFGFLKKYKKIQINRIKIGFLIFTIGLFKKIAIADQIGLYVDPLYHASITNQLSFFEAWFAAFGYGLQIYFDFSGYSDMAIGLGFLFLIRLPINFDSPYKSRSIKEFWQRWHITLSRFLRDYLYIPLGGSQNGKLRHFLNILITMALGGLWHGASLLFIIWGMMHALYIIINHIWIKLIEHQGIKFDNRFYNTASLLLTFLAVNIAWVPFRAPNLESMFNIYIAMFSFENIYLNPQLVDILPSVFSNFVNTGFNENISGGSLLGFMEFSIALFFLTLAVLFLPNSNTLQTKNSNKSIFIHLFVIYFILQSLYSKPQAISFIYFSF